MQQPHQQDLGVGDSMGETQAALDQFWPKVTEEVRTMSVTDLKRQDLPLARIKKIMKLDEDVKMISAEAPVLFGKACEMFIHELTMRAWVHTEDNKRRTLQRNDIAMAITKYDQFDFLIDIVPRDDIKPAARKDESSVRMAPDQVSYYFQLAQQHQQSLQNNTTTNSQPQQQQIQTQPQQQQVVQSGVQTITVNQQQQQQQQSQPQVIQLQPQQMNQSNTTNQPPPGGIQIVQQIIGPNGEIQQIPILLNDQQLQLIRAQMIGGTNQPIVIQTAPIQAQSVQQSAAPLQQVYIQQE